MPDFSFIIRDIKFGLTRGTISARRRKEVIEALREMDVLEIRKMKEA